VDTVLLEIKEETEKYLPLANMTSKIFFSLESMG
jgi:hypothetical protein